MKEVKQYKKSYVFLSSLYVALGIVLLARPSLSVQKIGNAIGIVMIVLGATYGILYLTKEKQDNFFLQMDLVTGIICLSFGIFIFVNPTFLSAVLPFAMGILLLLGAVVKIQSAINMKRLCFKRWYAVLILALVIIALGVVLLFNPFPEERWELIYIGCCLILDGLTNLISLICIQLRLKGLNRVQQAPDEEDRDLLEREQRSAGFGGRQEERNEIIAPADRKER